MMTIARLADHLTTRRAIATPVFDGAKEADIVEMLEHAGLDVGPGRPCMTDAPASRSTVR